MITEGWSKSARAAALPALLIGVLVALFFYLAPLGDPASGPALAEGLDVERVVVDAQGFVLHLRADSARPMTIAQAMVDGAYWQFSIAPAGPLKRFETATVRIDYPWVKGETHHLRLISSLGSSFDHSIETTLTTPRASAAMLVHYAVLGLLVGLVPILLGMLFFPAIRSLSGSGLEFILALTLGLLFYLFVDMTLEGLELARRASPLFGGAVLVIVPLLLTTAVLITLAGRKREGDDGLRLATLVATGIGFHNLGEGLAIGAAFASHELALGAFLIIGFSLHNTTEGIAIVSPLVRESVNKTRLLVLAMLAGLPVIAGIWLGAFMFSAHWAAIFFGIGAGAVLQVIGEIDHYLNQRIRLPAGQSRFSVASVAGYASGVALMYASSLLISV